MFHSLETCWSCVTEFFSSLKKMSYPDWTQFCFFVDLYFLLKKTDVVCVLPSCFFFDSAQAAHVMASTNSSKSSRNGSPSAGSSSTAAAVDLNGIYGTAAEATGTAESFLFFLRSKFFFRFPPIFNDHLVGWRLFRCFFSVSVVCFMRFYRVLPCFFFTGSFRVDS